MSDEDRERWFRRRRWPFFRSPFFEGFDDMFREMEEMMKREFKALSERAPRDLIREREMPNGSKAKEWGPFVYGYSVTIGPDGKPQIREFGNVKPEAKFGKPQINIKEEREPLVDIMEIDGEVKVIAELPGVEKKDIKIQGTETTLTISVDTPQRKYYKEVELPAKVDPKKAKSLYNNGVLEVTLEKKKEEKPKGESITIE
ncbi:MAG: Hsp20/alpha crystallin family protein [Candidatus Bathyarchaeota archaeon]|nr:Hsp20/alpha crystallin family protein [Candidatus Bathyarchaeota archaeon]